jgi:hypothetical protein
MHVTYPSAIGPITVIETRRKNRPVGLRKPYEYVLPLIEVNEIVSELRTALRGPTAPTMRASCGVFQCAEVSCKRLARGVKIDFFILGYRPGFCGATTGVTLPQWESVTKLVQDILTSYLGDDALAYIEPYSEDRKFQSRWEAYIMYEEFQSSTTAR